MEMSTLSSKSPEDLDKFIEELPRMIYMEKEELCKWEGFWFWRRFMKSLITFKSTFRAPDDDVFLTSTMKTGTTWLKAITICLMHDSNDHQDILSKEIPHFIVPTIDVLNVQNTPPPFDIYDDSSPRLLHTHLPYSILPDSIKNSNTKIVYIARNPKDTLISMWHFFNTWWQKNQEPIALDQKIVDDFCCGFSMYGSYFEHVLGYWEESKKNPEKILFIKYEDLKSDPEKQVVRIAEFLGVRPFGEAAKVVEMCSFERLKNVEVNNKGELFKDLPNTIFLRKGKVGGWKDYFTPQMEMQVNEACRTKLEPFGLFF